MADPIKLAERLSLLFQHLGIRRAIVAGSGNQELGALATAAPDLVSAMIVVCPAGLSPALRSLASRLLLIHGDCGPSSSVVPLGLPNLPGARALLLEDFFDSAWANPIEERLSAIAPALLDFVDDVSRDIPVAPVEPVAEDHGEVAGITYHVQGCGLPLVLFPIHLSSSQWEPLLPILNQHFRTITLGGVFLYPVSILEQRARTGFRDLVGNLIDACELRPGERVLEVGCGSGALARWLADRTRGANPIVGLDFNPFLLREAADLVAAEGVTGHIHFQQGDATALPFPANSFDVTMAITVLEEGMPTGCWPRWCASSDPAGGWRSPYVPPTCQSG